MFASERTREMAAILESSDDEEGPGVVKIETVPRSPAAADAEAVKVEPDPGPREHKRLSRLRRPLQNEDKEQDVLGASIVEGGLDPTTITMSERRQFGADQQRYLKARNAILEEWVRDHSRFLNLDDALRSCPQNVPRPLATRVYNFLCLVGAINRGILRGSPSSDTLDDVLGTSATLQRWVKAKVWKELEGADLEQMTEKKVRKKLEADYGPAETKGKASLFSALKPFIKEQIGACLGFLAKDFGDDKAAKREERQRFLREYFSVREGAADTGLGLGKTVVVVGAGPAGLNAATHLKRHGCTVVILEGRDRVGGRVVTDRSTFSVPVDLGASLITGTGVNVKKGHPSDPSTLLCKQIGAKLKRIEMGSDNIPLYDVAKARKEEDGKIDGMMEVFDWLLDKADDKATKLKAERMTSMKDQAKDPPGAQKLAAGMENLGDFFYSPDKDAYPDLHEKVQSLSEEEKNILEWHKVHLEYGCSAEFKEMSLEHWNQDEELGRFWGDHCMVPEGYLKTMESLANGLDVRTMTRVETIRYHEEGKVEVLARNQEDPIVADAVLVTVPLGCLKRAAIAFQPPLPQWKVDAIQRLGFGNLNKVVLEFERGEEGVFWERGVNSVGTKQGFGLIHDKKASWEEGVFQFWNMNQFCGAPILVGLLSGAAANFAEKGNDAAVVDRALADLRRIFHDVEVPDPVTWAVTKWGSDEWAFGSYSFVAAGASGKDYDDLSLPVKGLVHFAGEHTCREYPDTVGGAMITGLREAKRMLSNFHKTTLAGIDPDLEMEILKATETAEASNEAREESESEEYDSQEEEEDAEETKAVRAPKGRKDSKAKKERRVVKREDIVEEEEEKQTNKRSIGSVPYLSDAKFVEMKEEIKEVYKFFSVETRPGAEVLDLMRTLTSLDGRKAFVKQVSSPGRLEKVPDRMEFCSLLNGWILEYADAPLCEDFVCAMVKVVHRLKLTLQEVRESKGLAKTIRRVSGSKSQRIKKVTSHVIKAWQAQVPKAKAKAAPAPKTAPPKTDGPPPTGEGEVKGEVEGEDEGEKPPAPSDPEGALATTAAALDEIKEQEKLLLVAKNKHKSITKEFQKLAKKMGLVDKSAAVHQHKRKRDEAKEINSHKSHKGGSKDQRQVHQVKEYVREKLKKFYVDKKITKDQFKAIVSKVWAKLEAHKNLGQKGFLTRERKDKIKKMVNAYVKMKDKLSST